MHMHYSLFVTNTSSTPKWMISFGEKEGYFSENGNPFWRTPLCHMLGRQLQDVFTKLTAAGSLFIWNKLRIWKEKITYCSPLFNVPPSSYRWGLWLAALSFTWQVIGLSSVCIWVKLIKRKFQSLELPLNFIVISHYKNLWVTNR